MSSETVWSTSFVPVSRHSDTLLTTMVFSTLRSRPSVVYSSRSRKKFPYLMLSILVGSEYVSDIVDCINYAWASAAKPYQFFPRNVSHQYSATRPNQAHTHPIMTIHTYPSLECIGSRTQLATKPHARQSRKLGASQTSNQMSSPRCQQLPAPCDEVIQLSSIDPRNQRALI